MFIQVKTNIIYSPETTNTNKMIELGLAITGSLDKDIYIVRQDGFYHLVFNDQQVKDDAQLQSIQEQMRKVIEEKQLDLAVSDFMILKSFTTKGQDTAQDLAVNTLNKEVFGTDPKGRHFIKVLIDRITKISSRHGAYAKNEYEEELKSEQESLNVEIQNLQNRMSNRHSANSFGSMSHFNNPRRNFSSPFSQSHSSFGFSDSFDSSDPFDSHDPFDTTDLTREIQRIKQNAAFMAESKRSFALAMQIRQAKIFGFHTIKTFWEFFNKEDWKNQTVAITEKALLNALLKTGLAEAKVELESEAQGPFNLTATYTYSNPHFVHENFWVDLNTIRDQILIDTKARPYEQRVSRENCNISLTYGIANVATANFLSGYFKSALLFTGVDYQCVLTAINGVCLAPIPAPTPTDDKAVPLNSSSNFFQDPLPKLMNELANVCGEDKNYFQPVLTLVQQKNFGKALRTIANDQHAKAAKIAETMLAYKQSLNININEQAPITLITPLHLAAAKNIDIYNLLVSHGAKDDLLDAENKTAKQIYQQKNGSVATPD